MQGVGDIRHRNADTRAIRCKENQIKTTTWFLDNHNDTRSVVKAFKYYCSNKN